MIRSLEYNYTFTCTRVAAYLGGYEREIEMLFYKTFNCACEHLVLRAGHVIPMIYLLVEKGKVLSRGGGWKGIKVLFSYS